MSGTDFFVEPQMSPQIEFVPIDSLYFDPQNPRIPKELVDAEESDVLDWMLEEGQGNLPELMASIATQKFFSSEPLLVSPHPKKKGAFIVVEGNRRLASVKLLLDPSKASKLKKTIGTIVGQIVDRDTLLHVPVLKYAQREDVLKYLGYRHVTGIKTWGPLPKAKYLANLFASSLYADHEPETRLREIARNIGSRANTVARSLAGLKIYQRAQEQGFYGIEDMEEARVNFSLLTTALAYENINQFIGMKGSADNEQVNINDANLRKLLTWIYKKNSEGFARVTESRKLKDLNSVVGNREALEQFDKRGRSLEEAVVYTELPLQRYRDAVSESIVQLKSAHHVLPFIREGLEDKDQQDVMDIEAQVKALRVQVKSKLEASEGD